LPHKVTRSQPPIFVIITLGTWRRFRRRRWRRATRWEEEGSRL